MIVLLVSFAASHAAELKPETVKMWDDYVQTANSRMENRVRGKTKFLWIDDAPDRYRRVHAGEILISPVGEPNPKRVPSGLIHDWIGAAFIPGADLNDVLTVSRDYERYKDFYSPTVVDAKPLSRGLSEDQFSMVLLNKSLLTRTALDSEYKATYIHLDKRRWYSIAHSTRVQEIQDYGDAGERELPPGVGHGYLWRVQTFSRLEERDGGVYIELEVIALSRDIPPALRWIADPIVRRASKGALLTSLGQTRKAVLSSVEVARRVEKPRTADPVDCPSAVLCSN